VDKTVWRKLSQIKIDYGKKRISDVVAMLIETFEEVKQTK